jgi:hypothetical protein
MRADQAGGDVKAITGPTERNMVAAGVASLDVAHRLHHQVPL